MMMPMIIFINYYMNYLNWIILNVKYFINGNDEYVCVCVCHNLTSLKLHID
jgi:hypothetical protein